ncbi:hypothetical protein K438DRAFT_1729896 [Mycena galopus ATCC 62051]|nr:hypothetical protein K438DRAFT_1729896 [Mycena galopus ATCC 62051]
MVMDSFSVLDELVQVIYQGMDKFVLLSEVSDRWIIHVGMTGSGRWWHGSWSPADVRAIVGKSASDTLLESFAGKLAESIVDGELFVEVGERYKVISRAFCRLTLGPASKKPMHVELTEMTSVEAASYAADIFATIALNAQSRQSRLNPSAVFAASTTSVPSHPRISATEKKATGSAEQEEIKVLRAQLEKQQQKKRNASPEEIPSTSRSAAVAPRPLKGASLANPNKKARKYQAIEFESDEE